MSHALLVYSQDDTDAVLAVHETLRRAQIPTLYDPEGDKRGPLEETLRDSFCGIVLVSRHSVKSKDVRETTERLDRAGIPVVPVIVSPFKSGAKFHKDITKRPYLTMDKTDFASELTQTVKALYERACPVISVMNFKGGVGKTTVSAQLMGALQKYAQNRVLLIDLDPQANLTQFFLEFSDLDRLATEDRSVISLFEPGKAHKDTNPSPALEWETISDKLFVPAAITKLRSELLNGADLPGRLDLIAGQFEISKYAFSTDENGLRLAGENFLASIEAFRHAYDLIVLDTNPTATFLTRLAFDAANHVLAPIRADTFSLRGVELLTRLKASHATHPEKLQLHILFNGVQRNEPTAFEASVRDGALDGNGVRPISHAILERAIPRSGHLSAKFEEEPDKPWRRLAAHYSRGGGLGAIRRDMEAVSTELIERVGIRYTER